MTSQNIRTRTGVINDVTVKYQAIISLDEGAVVSAEGKILEPDDFLENNPGMTGELVDDNTGAKFGVIFNEHTFSFLDLTGISSLLAD